MSWINDLGYAIRLMRKHPGPAIFAILTLALGIGANTAMFSAVYAVLNSEALRSIRDPQSLVMLWCRNPAMKEFLAQRLWVSEGNYREWRRLSRSFENMTAFTTTTCILSGTNQTNGVPPKRVEAIRVQHNFFSLLGIRPAQGRVFTAEEAGKADDRVVLLSAALYKARFGNDPNLSRKRIRVDTIERDVIGVLPENYQMPAYWEGQNQPRPQIWMPLNLDNKNSLPEFWAPGYCIYARLRPGVTLTQARHEMNGIGERLRNEYPEQNKGVGINVFPIAEEDSSNKMRRSMLVLQFAVGFVLLIACANVGHILLTRSMAREREIAIRLALGARRRRIVRLMLIESLLLSILGCIVGLLVASWSFSGISAIAPEDFYRLGRLRLESPVLVYSIIITMATALLSGVMPALHSATQNINATLAKNSRWIGQSSKWACSGMVIGEVALALVLLIGAGLMIRSLQILMNVNLGFQTDHLLTARLTLMNPNGKEADAPRQTAFCSQLLARVQALPGVKSASLSSGLPMQSVTMGNYDIEGASLKDRDASRKDRVIPEKENWSIAFITRTTQDYFETMWIKLKRGRNFTHMETEAQKPGVVVVSESFARINWPDQEALGKGILLPGKNEPTRLTVVGIVADTRYAGPEGDINPEMFIPSRTFPTVNLALQTEGDPAAMALAIEKIIRSINPNQSIDNIRAMDQWLREFPSSAEKRFYMIILASFAGLALALASLGLYGVLSYVVTLRTRDLGVRMALGANTKEVFRLMIWQGFKLTLIGVTAGLIGAFLLTRLIQALIFGISTRDPIVFIVSVVLISVVALLASYLPARRATRIDPIESLRAE